MNYTDTNRFKKLANEYLKNDDEYKNMVKLHDLEIGNVFYAKKDKKRVLYKVEGKPLFNIHHGSATRECSILSTKELVSKSCRLEVVLYF